MSVSSSFQLIVRALEIVVIFMPYFQSIATLWHKYEAYIKGFPICFHDFKAKNDATDNNL